MCKQLIFIRVLKAPLQAGERDVDTPLYKGTRPHLRNSANSSSLRNVHTCIGGGPKAVPTTPQITDLFIGGNTLSDTPHP